MFNSITIHYSEIATKGKNRDFFEKALIENIKNTLKNNVSKVYKRYGKVICDIEYKSDFNIIKEKLQNTPGIAYFSFSVKTSLDLNDIKKTCLNFLKKQKFQTIKVICTRPNKSFKLKSQEINEQVGEFIINKLKKKAKMVNPDINLFIEISEKESYIYTEKLKCLGGLPVGVSGKIISSLSGGIDSPVASFLMMKRGCKIIFVHFVNKTQTSDEGILKKINNLVKQLTNFQINSKLYVIDFSNIQQQIISQIPAKWRMIIYRRFMMKILNKIAYKENSKGIVTGDNIGQVASQTIENLDSIYNASQLNVYSPLIGMNKQEIIEISQRIKTYEFSIMQYPDCCSYMIAQHPETKSKLKDIEKIEKNISDQEKLVRDCVEKVKIEKFET